MSVNSNKIAISRGARGKELYGDRLAFAAAPSNTSPQARARVRGGASFAVYLPPVRDLEPALALPADHKPAVRLAQFDLAGVSASGVDLLGDRGCSSKTRLRFALGDVQAPVDSEGDGFRVEVALPNAAEKTRLTQLRPRS